MNNFLKTVALSGAIVASSLALTSTSADAATSAPKVQINDSLVSFSKGKPFVDSKEYTQVPVRTLVNKLGADVTYAKIGTNKVKVTISKGSLNIVLRSGSNVAHVRSKQVKMDTSMKVKNGHTYVPVRFVSESFGHTLKWDAKNRIAMISTDGKSHKPAYIASTTSKGTKAVSIGKQYLGVPYVWGGTTPSGFDCSGYITYVYKQLGVSLPRTSSAMHSNAGTPVSKSNLKQGDLVFFVTNKVSTSHVGIYMGDGKFLSATSKGVTVASLNSSYWGPKYNGANRIL